MRLAGSLSQDGSTVVLDSEGNTTSLSSNSPAGNITITLPATTATLGGVGINNAWTGTNSFAANVSLGGSADLAINTNKFTVAAATGNTSIAGTLGITGVLTLEGEPISISSAATGDVLRYNGTTFVNATTSGTGDVSAAVNFGTDNILIKSDGTAKGTQLTGITVADTTDNVSGMGTLGCGAITSSGDLAVGTSKFDVTAATGNTLIAGTLEVTGEITATAGIADSNLDTISTANKVALTALNIDGGTDIAGAIADADLFILDDGAGGTNKYTAASRITTYVSDLTLTTAAQTAITSVGTLTSLAVGGAVGITGADTANYLTIKNTTASDVDGARYGKVIFQGTQSGTEVTDLAHIVAKHDGAADDQKGRLELKTNDGNDGSDPLTAFTCFNDNTCQSHGSLFVGSSNTAVGAGSTKLEINTNTGTLPSIALSSTSDTISSGVTSKISWFVGSGNAEVAAIECQVSGTSEDAANIRFLTANTGALVNWMQISKDGTWYYTNLAGGAGTAMKINTGTGIIVYDSSSRKYKDNLRAIPYGLDTVLSMEPTQFEYKKDGTTDVGFIAEDLNPIMPECVGLNKDGEPESVHYDRITAVLTKAIQELTARVVELEGAA